MPPCIQQTASGMIQIAIDVEDKARTKAVSKITADEVGVALTYPVGQCDDELLEFLGKVLHLRLPQMSLLRGWSTRSKLLMVQGLSATQVYERLHKSMEENRKRIERLVNLHSADNRWLSLSPSRASLSPPLLTFSHFWAFLTGPLDHTCCLTLPSGSTSRRLRSWSPSIRSWRSRRFGPRMTWTRTISSGSRAGRRNTGIRFARKESGPTNIYKAQSKTAGSNWNDTKI